MLETLPRIAAEPLYVPPVADATSPGEPATGNVLANANVPTGATASVTSFSVPGSSAEYPAGTTATLTDPETGAVTGTVLVNPDGSYVFTPAPNYVGPVPTVTVSVSSSDGQSAQVPLSLSVNTMLLDANESPSTIAGTPLTVNVLANAVLPPGTTANVSSFTLPGTGIVYPAGPNPVPVVDPVTKSTVGSVVVQPDGTATFTPAPGYIGQAPAITYTVASSDGQISPGALSVTVLSGKPGLWAFSASSQTLHMVLLNCVSSVWQMCTL